MLPPPLTRNACSQLAPFRQGGDGEADGDGGGGGGEYANVAEAHVAHAEFLWRRLGSVEAARGVYKRCFARARMESAISAPGAGPDGQAVLCRAWLRLEREAGAVVETRSEP